MADDEKTHVVHQVSTLQEISRGDEPEYKLDFKKFEELKVFDELGNSIRFGNIYKDKKTIIILVRHFLDFIAKEYVEDLARIPQDHFQNTGVHLVVIGCAHWKFIRAFRKCTGYNQTLYCDPDGQLYKSLGCFYGKYDSDGLQYSRNTGSKHVKSGIIMGIAKSTWRAMQSGGEWQGDIEQQGASFILGPGDRVDHIHLDKHAMNHSSINDLLEIAHLPTVSFEKDERVLNI